MPKVYITQEQRDRERIKKIIKTRMVSTGVRHKMLASALGITSQAFSYKLNHASFTLVELVSMNSMLKLTLDDLAQIIGVKRDDGYERYLKEILFLLKQKTQN